MAIINTHFVDLHIPEPWNKASGSQRRCVVLVNKHHFTNGNEICSLLLTVDANNVRKSDVCHKVEANVNATLLL